MTHQHRTENRCSFSTLRVSTLVVMVTALLLLDITTAQFTNTYGWGGAGNGKRSYDKIADSASAVSDKCLPDKILQHYIFKLIQGELARLRKCKEAEKIATETSDYSDLFQGLYP